MRFSTTPTPRPTRQATMAEVKRANRAAASAGMTSSGTVVGSREVSDPASTPRMPTTREARRVLAMASPLGDRPASTPDTSLSAVARVARPNLVKRYSRVSAMATRTAAPGHDEAGLRHAHAGHADAPGRQQGRLVDRRRRTTA